MANANLRRKVIGVPLEKAAQQGDGSLLVLGKFTSDMKDEVGDIITRSATERALPKYKRWGNIRRMHLPEPVGKVTRIGTEDGLEWNEVEIKVIDPKAKFEVENGLLQALSVGILVNYNDMDFLEDGGWIINDYQLAEISLVDHPANYDAALETLHLSLDGALRDQIREQGVVPVLRSIGVVPTKKGELMEGNPVQVDETEGTVEQPVAEAQAETPVEEVKDLEATEEDAPAAEEETPAVEAVVAEVATTPDPAAILAEALQQFSLAISALTTKVDGLVAQKEEPAPEADVESTDEVAKGISGEDDRVAQLEKQVQELSAQLTALSTPVDRKGAIPVDEEATEEEAAETREAEMPKAKNLTEAVGLYVKSRPAARR